VSAQHRPQYVLMALEPRCGRRQVKYVSIMPKTVDGRQVDQSLEYFNSTHFSSPIIVRQKTISSQERTIDTDKPRPPSTSTCSHQPCVSVIWRFAVI